MGTVIQCEECDQWRLLFSKKKLDPQCKNDLDNLLEDISYSCGTKLDELDLPDNLKSVCVKHHECHDPIEKLYYSSGFEPICIHCSSMDVVAGDDGSDDTYPQCIECGGSKAPIKRPNRKREKSSSTLQ